MCICKQQQDRLAKYIAKVSGPRQRSFTATNMNSD